MSYDVWLEIDTGGPEPATVGNYTSNVAPMWAGALGHSLRDLHHQECSVALDRLRAAVRVMEAEPDRFRAMNPANGWGDYEGALGYLRDLAAACAAHPKARIAISA